MWVMRLSIAEGYGVIWSMDSVVRPERNPEFIHLHVLHFQCSARLCKLRDHFVSIVTFILSTANTDRPIKPPLLFISVGRWDHHQSGFSSRASPCLRNIVYVGPKLGETFLLRMSFYWNNFVFTWFILVTFSLCLLIDSWVILRYFVNCKGIFASYEAQYLLFLSCEYENMDEMNKFSEKPWRQQKEATIVGRDWPDVNLLGDLVNHSWCLEQKLLSLSSI
jgi:hypothetical protein